MLARCIWYLVSTLIFFALLAALTHSIYSLVNKVLMARGGLGALPATLLLQSSAAAMAVPLLLAGRVALVPAALPQLLAIALISTTSFVLVMAAFAREDASAVGPVLGLKVIFLAVLEVLLDQKALAPGVAWGAGLSVVGIALVSQTDQWSLHPRALLRPGMALMGVAALGFAVCDRFVGQALGHWGGNSWAFNLYLVLFMGGLSFLALLCMPVFRRRTVCPDIDCATHWPTIKPIAGWLALCAALLLTTQFCFFTSLSVGQLTLTNIIYNLRGIMVVLLAAALVLGRGSDLERAGWRAYTYRTLGSLLTVGAIVLALLVK